MPTPIILDCDPGHDDAIALLLAARLARGRARRRDDRRRATRRSRRRPRTRCACSSSPAAATSRSPRAPTGPLVRERSVAAHVHGESGLDGPDLPPPSRRRSTAARGRASWPSEIRERDGELTLVPTGPLTNIALLLALEPDARPERIVLMGGAIGEGNRTPAAEFNIWADPEAARRVFESGIDVTMIGLDVTHQALITDARRRAAARRRAGRADGRRAARLLLALPPRVVPRPRRLADARPGRASRTCSTRVSSRRAARRSRSTAAGSRAAAARTSTGAAARERRAERDGRRSAIDARARSPSLLISSVSSLGRLGVGGSQAASAARSGRAWRSTRRRHPRRREAPEDACRGPGSARGEAARACAAHHHPELVGLALSRVGVFLACVLWFGLNGGPVTHARRIARSAGPPTSRRSCSCPLGALIVTRSALVALRPVPARAVRGRRSA